MLFHTDLRVPDQVKSQIRQTGLVVPKYSQHAQDVAREREIELPDLIDYTKCRPFEIECKKDGTIEKVAYRTSYADDPKRDLILIVHPADNFVRTVWLNRVEDQHATLDRSLYKGE